ncbi:MAG: hypothetical protein V4454_14145 [Pseudomonadota bacterium]
MCIWVLSTAGLADAAPDGELYQCPRNLFTNQMDKAQALLKGCSRAMPGRITQAAGGPELESADPVPAAAVPAAVSATMAAGDRPLAGSVATPTAQKVAPVVQARIAPAIAAPARSPDATGMRVPTSEQSARDQDAQTILRSELASTQAALEAAQRSGGAAQSASLLRLRDDEAALRRELARLNR